jgi:hypothetical protein
MDFSLLKKAQAKINSEDKSKLTKEGFCIETFLKSFPKIESYTKTYLEKDPILLLDSAIKMDELIEIHTLENNMSLKAMLEEY